MQRCRVKECIMKQGEQANASTEGDGLEIDIHEIFIDDFAYFQRQLRSIRNKFSYDLPK